MSVLKKRPVITKIKIPEVQTSKLKTKKHYQDLSESVSIVLKNGQECHVSYSSLEYVSELGRGQFGVVTKMIHKPSGELFAVKTLREDLIDTCESRDIEVSIKLGDKCRNLVRFYGTLFFEGYYLVLTEVMDASLDIFYQKVFDTKLRLPEAFFSMTGHAVLNALQYMKYYRIMHRDIKPSNVLLNSLGEIKVCDYGISGFLNNESLCKSFKGCHSYMAIEIATGVHPYSDFNQLFDLTSHILVNDPPRLPAEKFSSEFCSFVDSCLIKDEASRPRVSELMHHKFIEVHNEKCNDKTRAIIQFVCDKILSDN